MSTEPQCPKCQSEYTYAQGHLWICPTCSHEWSDKAQDSSDSPNSTEVTEHITRDAYGTPLRDGDDVTIIKDLKVKGASGSVKIGTKVKDIRIIDGDDGHDIACKIKGFGAMNLKSEFVRKA